VVPDEEETVTMARLYAVAINVRGDEILDAAGFRPASGEYADFETIKTMQQIHPGIMRRLSCSFLHLMILNTDASRLYKQEGPSISTIICLKKAGVQFMDLKSRSLDSLSQPYEIDLPGQTEAQGSGWILPIVRQPDGRKIDPIWISYTLHVDGKRIRRRIKGGTKTRLSSGHYELTPVNMIGIELATKRVDVNPGETTELEWRLTYPVRCCRFLARVDSTEEIDFSTLSLSSETGGRLIEFGPNPHDVWMRVGSAGSCRTRSYGYVIAEQKFVVIHDEAGGVQHVETHLKPLR